MGRAPGLLLASTLLAGAAASADGADPLGDRLGAALSSSVLRGARVGALVVDGNGAVLFAREPDRALVPASNQKVLTAIGALASFGPTHRFTTRIHADAVPDAQGAVGTLYVRGGGDPALTSEDWWRLAADLRRAGLRKVRGDLVLDDSAFDRERWHPAWEDVGSRAYHAPVSALAANYGAFAVEVGPSAKQREPARVSLDPPIPWFELANQALTGAAGPSRHLDVVRVSRSGGERVIVSGVAPLGRPAEVFYRSVAAPTLYAGSVLAWQLRSLGVEIKGKPRRGALPAGAPELLAFEGKPLADIVRLFLKYSNNMIAEGLVKALGAQATGEPGSWASGMAALRQHLAGLGLGLEGARLVDGSGLARSNRASPRLLVAALRLASNSFDFGPEFLAGLPIAAADGTLEKRAGATAGAVRAKTGLLDGVTALSGYARLRGGRQAVFSVIVNGYESSDEAAMEAVDAFAQVLVGADEQGLRAGSQESVSRAPRRSE